MKNLGPSVCGSNQMQAFQARVCNLAKMGAVPHKNSMATRRLHYGGMAEMQCWLGPSQVPQPTCYWKWHSWQLGNLTRWGLETKSQPIDLKIGTFSLIWSHSTQPKAGWKMARFTCFYEIVDIFPDLQPFSRRRWVSAFPPWRSSSAAVNSKLGSSLSGCSPWSVLINLIICIRDACSTAGSDLWTHSLP